MLLQYNIWNSRAFFGSSRDEVLVQGCPCNAYVGGTRLPRKSANRPPSGTVDCLGPDGEVAGSENRSTPYLQRHVCAYPFLAPTAFRLLASQASHCPKSLSLVRILRSGPRKTDVFGNGFRTGHMRFERLDWMRCMLYPSYVRVLDAPRPPSLYAETRARYGGCCSCGWCYKEIISRNEEARQLSLSFPTAPLPSIATSSRIVSQPRGDQPPGRVAAAETFQAPCPLSIEVRSSSHATPPPPPPPPSSPPSPTRPFLSSFGHEFLLLSSKRLRRR